MDGTPESETASGQQSARTQDLDSATTLGTLIIDDVSLHLVKQQLPSHTTEEAKRCLKTVE